MVLEVHVSSVLALVGLGGHVRLSLTIYYFYTLNQIKGRKALLKPPPNDVHTVSFHIAIPLNAP